MLHIGSLSVASRSLDFPPVQDLLAVHRYLSGLLLILERVYIHKIYCIFYSTWQVARWHHVFFVYYFIDTKKQAKQVSGWYDIPFRLSSIRCSRRSKLVCGYSYLTHFCLHRLDLLIQNIWLIQSFVDPYCRDHPLGSSWFSRIMSGMYRLKDIV